MKSGDMALIPGLSTGIPDPFWEVPTPSFICYVLKADTKRLYFRDPRVIARRAEEYEVRNQPHPYEVQLYFDL